MVRPSVTTQLFDDICDIWRPRSALNAIRPPPLLLPLLCSFLLPPMRAAKHICDMGQLAVVGRIETLYRLSFQVKESLHGW